MRRKSVPSYPSAAPTLRAKALYRLSPAVHAVVEHLEGRQLFAADPFANENDVQGLPLVLDFDGSSSIGLHDKDGEHLGFTRVQVNKNGRAASYVQANLDQVNGQLRITTTGSSTTGSNFNNDNTLTNAVETTFNAATGSFAITARLVGPLSYIVDPSEQAGISFGPGQDNYIKLVAVARQEGPRLQFVDEELVGTSTYNHVLDVTRDVGSFAGITSLDLRITGDAATGKVSAFYSINGGSFVMIPQELTLGGTRKTAFFSGTARAGLIALHKNSGGAITASFDRFEIQPGIPAAARPGVASVNPANGATDVSRDQFISAQVNLTAGGIDSATLNNSTVRLYRTSDHQVVAANVGTSGGGDVIILTPSFLLDRNTSYTLEITDGLMDVAGNAFAPFSATFTTGTAGDDIDPSYSFEKVALSTATGERFTALAVGPDRRLYAGTVEGRIFRFSINSTTGALGAPQILNVIRSANGGANRLLTGLVFDPASTANNPILWATHGQYRFGLNPNGSIDEDKYADDWTGKISKITNLGGNNAGTYTDVVTNLPRSVRDHLTNQPSFGPDGALYIPQGSNSAGGAPDAAWGNRPERLLSGAILRLDPSGFNTTTNVRTQDGGTYNPFASGAKLTIYATGVRNAYDIVWTQDGFLYAPTNGTAKGANTPGNGGSVPALTGIGVQHDFLFKIVQGGYYGHPNPLRNEFVHGAGYTPSNGVGAAEVPEYGQTIQPDSDYEGHAYDFDLNISPNGVIEYRNTTHFGGSLAGKLIVARYSGPDDLIVLTKDSSGAITAAQKGIVGFGSLVDPLDVIEDPVTGFIYVSEYSQNDSTKRKLTLLRPIPPGANATPDKPRLVFTDIQSSSANGSGTSAAQTVTIRNTGTSLLTIPAGGVSIIDDPAVSGSHAAEFEAVNWPTLPAQIPVGESISFQVRFRAASVGLKAALLRILSNDSTGSTLDINLRGIGTSSESSGDVGGSTEPSLQRILNAFQLPINVGDANGESTYDLPTPRPAGTVHDEIEMQRMEKAGAGPVRIEPLAEFAFNTKAGYVAHVGYYSPGTRDAKTELYRVDWDERTSVNPTWGATFDPGSTPFALYGEFPGSIFDINGVPRGVYSEDVFNTWDSVNHKKVRFFPLKNPDGSLEPNAYVFAFEEYHSGYDSNDVVGIIRNVKPAAGGPEIGTQNLDRQASTESGGAAVRVLNPTHLSFSRIQLDPPDPIPDNVVHDQAKLRIRNSGDAPLTVGSLVLAGGSASSFQIVNPPAANTVIDAGDFLDVTVRFIATSGRIKNATLTINSNDADEPATIIQLSGFWQNRSENNEEPNLPEIIQLFGYSTQPFYAGEQFSVPGDEGRVRRTGDEVLSPFWRRANPAAAVEVIQLAAYHTQGNVAIARWHFASSTTTSNIFTHEGVDGQTILPHLQGSSTSVASGTFKPAAQGSDTNPAFGFRIDSEWSDPTRNPQEEGGGGYGHHVRFFVAKDSAGNVIPHTYLMTMDYSGINYDYQDNVFLVRNIVPVSGPSAPTGPSAQASGGGIALNWNDNPEVNVAGYNVYRGTTSGFTPSASNRQNTTGLLTHSDFNDIFAPSGQTSYYKISAVDSAGNESGFTSVSATRNTDTTPPAIPANLTATGSPSAIALDWNNNTESDLAGYDVFRATVEAGPYTKLNTSGLLTTSSYVDATASVGVTYFYRVVALDQSGNDSAPATGSGARGEVTAPAAPSGLDATPVSPIQINLAWNSSASATSYRIERRVLGAATFDEIASNVTGTTFQDTGRDPETTYEYQVRAENSAGVSDPSNLASATTPAVGSVPSYTGTPIGTSGSHVVVTDGSAYDVTAGGTTINGTADQFYFLHRSVTGDFDVKVRVDGITGGNNFSRGGLMARASTSAGSAHVMVSASNADGFRTVRRMTDGGSSTVTKNGTPAYPNAWVRLRRVGNTFTTFYGNNGTSWTQIFSLTVNLPETVLLGLATSAYGASNVPTFRYRELRDTTAPQPPGVPGTLTATGVSPTQVDLAWGAAANATSYRVERKGPGDLDFVEIAQNVTTTSYQDTGRTANTTYEYRVRAVGAGGLFSGYGNVASATTQPDVVVEPPAAPTNLDAVAFSHNQINLSWTASIGATSYRIERRILGAATFDEIASNVTGTNYQDTGRDAETTYEYQIRAENSAGPSDYSNTDSATTPAAPAAPLYTGIDIASTLPGNTTALPDGSGFDIVAGGGNIQNNSDSFHFAYREITGDFDIKGQLANLTDTNGSPKAGFMARSSLAANSANVYSHVASNGYRISRRLSSGATTSIISSGGMNTYPNTWLRLRRVGNAFTAFRSTDGVNWITIGGYTQTMPGTLFVGMAVTAQSGTQTTTAQFRNVGDFVTAPPTAPTAPTGLQASAPNSTQVNLTWGASAGATNYRVERKGPGDADFVEIAGNVSTTSYQDTGRTADTTYEYRVRAENGVGPSPYSSIASVTTPDAPAPSTYTSVDISTTLSSNTTALPDGSSFNTVSSGGNIQNNADSFHFVYREITGDFDIKAQIQSMSDTNGSPKAGLMARTSLAANSANIYSHIASNGYRISRRLSSGAGTEIISSGGMNTFPGTWVRLRRVGNTFTAFRSTDGVNWVTIGAYTQSMPTTLLVGMATTAQSSTQTTSVEYRNVG